MNTRIANTRITTFLLLLCMLSFNCMNDNTIKEITVEQNNTQPKTQEETKKTKKQRYSDDFNELQKRNKSWLACYCCVIGSLIPSAQASVKRKE